MSSLNLIVLGGNLGAAPEERAWDPTKKICTFRLANNRWDSKKKTEVTDWYSVSAFGQSAEFCLKYLDKGSAVVVEGRAIQKEWEKDGHKQRSIEVLASRVSFLGPKRGSVEPTAGGVIAIEASPSDIVPF